MAVNIHPERFARAIQRGYDATFIPEYAQDKLKELAEVLEDAACCMDCEAEAAGHYDAHRHRRDASILDDVATCLYDIMDSARYKEAHKPKPETKEAV